ncbi:MAG: hypothetical protein IJU16_01510, partial [Clostridia bacterium]|nr:hypothetical protein [Clostridia bacterium]
RTNGFGRQNFPQPLPQSLDIRQYAYVLRLRLQKILVSYKTASHLKKKKIREIFGAKDDARLTPCEDNKPKSAEFSLFQACCPYRQSAIYCLSAIRYIGPVGQMRYAAGHAARYVCPDG